MYMCEDSHGRVCAGMADKFLAQKIYKLIHEVPQHPHLCPDLEILKPRRLWLITLGDRQHLDDSVVIGGRW